MRARKVVHGRFVAEHNVVGQSRPRRPLRQERWVSRWMRWSIENAGGDVGLVLWRLTHPRRAMGPPPLSTSGRRGLHIEVRHGGSVEVVAQTIVGWHSVPRPTAFSRGKSRTQGLPVRGLGRIVGL